jgi:hypothetical protein
VSLTKGCWRQMAKPRLLSHPVVEDLDVFCDLALCLFAYSKLHTAMLAFVRRDAVCRRLKNYQMAKVSPGSWRAPGRSRFATKLQHVLAEGACLRS